MRSSFLAVPLFLLILPVSARLEAAGVDLELVTEQGFPLTGPQRWIEAFQGLEVQLRIVRPRRATGSRSPRGAPTRPRCTTSSGC